MNHVGDDALATILADYTLAEVYTSNSHFNLSC
jgi:hypothetical protein